MILSKTQIEVMKIFASKITAKFSIRQISVLIKKPYPMIYKSVKSLIGSKLVAKDERNLISLNYKENHQALSYIESLRSETFLEKNKTIDLFVKDVFDQIKLDFFVLLVFGSYAAEKRGARDVDILLILPDERNINEAEKILDRIASNFSIVFHAVVISTESAREMIHDRSKPNVINETLDNHILLFGAENYYRLLKYAR